jgi:FkbM family methyltransferase
MALAMSLKHLALQFLPKPLLQPLRKAHYANKLIQDPGEPEMDVIPLLLPRGGCTIDLGANFGLYTRLLSEIVGAKGCVHAVEPVPESFGVLQSNVRRLRLDNVTLHHLAVSDSERLVKMTVPKYDRGGENLYEARVLCDSSALDVDRVIHVPADRLDNLFGRLGRIDFIKCDVEAHELSVIRGAAEILRVHRPAWMMEVSGDPDDSDSRAAELVRLMAKSGYRMYHIDADRRTANCFFLRPEHIRRIGATIESPPFAEAA